jgi:hypothetical protein
MGTKPRSQDKSFPSLVATMAFEAHTVLAVDVGCWAFTGPGYSLTSDPALTLAYGIGQQRSFCSMLNPAAVLSSPHCQHADTGDITDMS